MFNQNKHINRTRYARYIILTQQLLKDFNQNKNTKHITTTDIKNPQRTAIKI
jgi:hypothetical protein